MNLFIYALADIIHFAKIIFICNMFFQFRKREFKNIKIIILFIIFLLTLVSATIYLLQYDLLETLIYIFFSIALVCLLYRENIWRVAIDTIWILFACSLLDTMNIVLANFVLDILQLNNGNMSILIASLVSLLFISVIGRLYKKNCKIPLQKLGFLNFAGFTVLLVADVCVVSAIVVGADMFEEKVRTIYLVSVIMVIIGIFIQLAAVIILFTQRNVYKEKEQITDTFLNEQKNHYEYLESRERETKKFRHDLRSHMELISNLVRSHEYDKIDNYIEQMQLKIDTFGNIVTVQNGIVDAIINQYYTKAKQSGIKMEVKGMFPVDCEIEAYDLCTIFSNALSNAYEAAIESDEKNISMECGYTDKNIIVVIRNSFNNKTKNGKTHSEKNKDYHGFGLENIKDSINKYNGFLDIEKSDTVFSLKIIFKYSGT